VHFFLANLSLWSREGIARDFRVSSCFFLSRRIPLPAPPLVLELGVIVRFLLTVKEVVGPFSGPSRYSPPLVLFFSECPAVIPDPTPSTLVLRPLLRLFVLLVGKVASEGYGTPPSCKRPPIVLSELGFPLSVFHDDSFFSRKFTLSSG